MVTYHVNLARYGRHVADIKCRDGYSEETARTFYETCCKAFPGEDGYVLQLYAQATTPLKTVLACSVGTEPT